MSDDQRNAILDAFRALRETNPRTPAISMAECIGVSEGALQASRLGEDVMTLPYAATTVAGMLHTLGPVKALTRSRLAVLEQTGEYPRLQGGPHAGLLLAPRGLDLRLIFSRWHWACLIRDELPEGERWSLQVFDQSGNAVHKAFSVSERHLSRWQEIWEEGTSDAPCFVDEATPSASEIPATAREGLKQDWGSMTDVHQFFALLRRHHLSRLDANRLMEGEFTQALPTSSVASLLDLAAAEALPLMLFVSSRGCVQIRTGDIVPPQRMRGWLNLFMDDATLHLNDTCIDQVWTVHKPNRDGGVTSLEAFDQHGELALQIYAERREGEPESRLWRTLLDRLVHHQAA
ncbi:MULTISPECIES: ChuX/HutX family heme-like substrate-binding protein [unclassified Halomonas]|uniref:ChuX/HutX family heme-like substrate-binding protein n=1 Tax=unclassified Halomonas TaxID=2609666 RepID=UPI001C94900A|nr:MULTISPECIES: ChuX/HutX family heme-like substrate-binding protein [unclassified Halomonas]MBY5926664.1 heme degradation protein [Halomonas sp. DP4Y7-2]MBY6233623.1 heme degradation protein [Halomonas sp. DP4Y7-1]